MKRSKVDDFKTTCEVDSDDDCDLSSADDDCSHMKCSDLWGEVVWAKIEGFPFWPCYVYNPADIDEQNINVNWEIKTKAQSCIHEKVEHLVYFYADQNRYGFVESKNIRLYNLRKKEIYSNVVKKSTKNYRKFQIAMRLADEEARLPKIKRLSWNNNRRLSWNKSTGSSHSPRKLRREGERGKDYSQVGTTGDSTCSDVLRPNERKVTFESTVGSSTAASEVRIKNKLMHGSLSCTSLLDFTISIMLL